MGLIDGDQCSCNMFTDFLLAGSYRTVDGEYDGTYTLGQCDTWCPGVTHVEDPRGRYGGYGSELFYGSETNQLVDRWNCGTFSALGTTSQ